MPVYRLIYFNAKGRAELARWLFAYADVLYVDERFERENWSKYKKDFPGGKLPVLMIDDRQLNQSMSIARYLAKEFGLAPKDHLEAAHCDAVVDSCVEVLDKLYGVLTSSKAEAEKKKECTEIAIPFLTLLNKSLEGKEWFISDKITWADLEIAFVVDWIIEKTPVGLEFTSLVSHMKKVCALPAIKKWIKQRPATEF